MAKNDPMTPPSVMQLTDLLRQLPGVGPKSAQRMCLHLLHKDRVVAAALGQALLQAVNLTRSCKKCNGLTEQDICKVCLDNSRDAGVLCVVENPADMLAIEATGTYRGLYYVLMAKYAPLDGVAPQELGVDRLLERVQDGLVTEVILATNFTNEGEATAFFLQQRLKHFGLRVSRIARGIPIGAEIEYIDPSTVARALLDRQKIKLVD
jgi:recombination protein RecR